MKHKETKASPGFPSNVLSIPRNAEAWHGEAAIASINQMHDATIQTVQTRIDWYDAKSSRFGALARWFRRVALCLAALGAVAPLVSSLLADFAPQDGQLGIDIDNIGYLLVAIAGALVGYDNFFGLSDSWMRYRVTQAALVRRLSVFKYDWAARMAELSQSPLPKEIAALLRIQRRFIDTVEAAIQSETSTWANRLKTRLSSYDQQKSFETYDVPVGGVDVFITNWAELDRKSTRLTIDGEVMQINDDGKVARRDLIPRSHDLVLKTPFGETERSVVIQPNSVEMIEMTGAIQT